MARRSAVSDPLTRRVVRLLHAGHTIDQVAHLLGVHRSKVYRCKVAGGLPRCWSLLSDGERRRIRELIEADYSRRQVAKIVRRGLGTVARLAAGLQDRGPQHRTRAYRCEGCGYLVQVTPCVICAARRGPV